MALCKDATHRAGSEDLPLERVLCVETILKLWLWKHESTQRIQ